MPETILIAADRQPRLTDFDRSFIPDTNTVYAATEDRHGNPAYMAPELRDRTQYATNPGADMYSLGVLLYHLLTDAVPFLDPAAAIKAGGMPAKLPSQYHEGVPAKFDDLVQQLLNVTDPISAAQCGCGTRDSARVSRQHGRAEAQPFVNSER